MRDLLVTGTDTDVGKTLVTAALLLALRKRGVRALGFKPAETGFLREDESDSFLLAQASGVSEENARPLLRLQEALAPALAAERAGVRLEPSEILERVRTLRSLGYTLAVEGAGGILVPIVWGFTALDLAEEAGLEVLIVARAGLGTLNHVLLTAEAVRRGGVRVRGVVLNGAGASPDLAETTNPDVLRRLLPETRVLVLQREPEAPTLDIARHVAEAVSSFIDA